MCPRCGSRFTQNEQAAGVAPTDEAIKGKFKGQTKPMIISGKKTKKNYFDKQGNLITDPDIIDLIKKGANVISYREDT
jgi:hypothetical protein